MKKHYPIQPPIEIKDYDRNENVFDADLPVWLKKEIKPKTS